MNRFLMLAAAALVVLVSSSCGRLPEKASGSSASEVSNPLGSDEADNNIDIAGVVVNSDETVIRPSEAPQSPQVTGRSIDEGPAAPDTGADESTEPAETPTEAPLTSLVTPTPVPKDDPVVPENDDSSSGDGSSDDSSGQTHIVTLGETLSTIAQKYGVSTQALKETNGLGDADVITEGQKLDIPG